MSKIKLSTYRARFNRQLLKVDRSFNRRIVWTSSEANRYFSSLLRNRVPSPHVMANIQDCISFSKENGDITSEEYYRQWHNKGFKYISLDGQNRGENILRLLDDEIAISGVFVDADGKEVTVENKFFSKLPVRLQDAFKDSCVTIEIYTDVLKPELTTIFKDIQAGCPLNAQETRNATLSPIASWVRNLRETHENVSKRITNDDKIIRMIDDENIAKIAMVLYRRKEWGLGRHAIDEWYDLGQDYNTLEDPSCPYGADEIKRIEGIIEMFGSVINNQTVYPPSVKVANKAWWATLYACEWAYDNDYAIHSAKDFFKKLKEIDDKLITDSELDYSQTRSKIVNSGGDPDKVSRSNYYFKWQSLPHQAPARNRRKIALVREMVKNKKDLTLRKKASKNAA